MASYANNIIKSITPVQDETGVSLDASVVILFSETMDPKSLSLESIFLSRGSKVVPSIYTVGNINKELTIQPKVLLEGDQTYTVTVLSKESGPKTAFGNLSSRNYIFHFTTEEEKLPDLPEEPAIEQPPLDEPIETVNPPDESLETWEDPSFLSLELVDSYPNEGNLVSELDSIVLFFDQVVDATEVSSFVYLREKAISSLLSKLNNTNKIPCSISPSSENQTVVLNPVSPVRKGISYELVLEKEISAKNNPALTLGNEKVISFQMQWELFYSTVEAVKLLLGVFKDIYTDAEIATMIHQESLATYQMMSMKDDFDPLLWDKKAPYAASQYVLYRTAYQAILGQVIETSSGMKQSIKLADLSVGESSSVSSQITDLMGLFQAEMDKWWKLLNGLEEDVDGTYRPKLSKTTGSATRGSTDYPYPDWMKRVPYKDLGG